MNFSNEILSHIYRKSLLKIISQRNKIEKKANRNLQNRRVPDVDNNADDDDDGDGGERSEDNECR